MGYSSRVTYNYAVLIRQCYDSCSKANEGNRNLFSEFRIGIEPAASATPIGWHWSKNLAFGIGILLTQWFEYPSDVRKSWVDS